jgi:hypothetical protein
MMAKNMSGSREQTKSFAGLWRGGYYSGDPLDPVGVSDYRDLGYISVHHATYQVCIRPYVDPDTVVLEIGPGRGSWTKTMLDAKEIWCLDALSAEYNQFWDYVGGEQRASVKYLQVDDFSCADLPEDHFDFLFSFGTFCHIPWEGQCEYYRNLYPKMRRGAHAMVMIPDFDKYNNAIRNFRHLRAKRIDGNVFYSSLRDVLTYTRRYLKGGTCSPFPLLDKHDQTPAPGRWYHAGVQETCEFLKSVGWDVVNADVGLNHRDPIVHFRKP